jgi:hypothetical protein
LAYFGLTVPVSIDTLRAVYRKRVMSTHPDHGGTAETFQELQGHYEAAIEFLVGGLNCSS